jgi:hypothetical protein
MSLSRRSPNFHSLVRSSYIVYLPSIDLSESATQTINLAIMKKLASKVYRTVEPSPIYIKKEINRKRNGEEQGFC